MTKTWGFWPKTSTFRGPKDSGKVVLHLDKIFKKHKPKSSEQSISEICHQSADLRLCALMLHILAHLEDASGKNPRLQEQTPFWEWGFRVVLVLEWKSLQNSTEGTRLCRRLSVFCCNRQLALDYSHTAKDKLPLLQTSGHFRRLYSHFLPLLTQYKTVFFPRSPPFATHTKQSAPCPITYFITSTAADLQGGKL